MPQYNIMTRNPVLHSYQKSQFAEVRRHLRCNPRTKIQSDGSYVARNSDAIDDLFGCSKIGLMA